MRHTHRVVALLLTVLVGLLTACGSDEQSSPTTIEITFDGDRVTPMGERFDAKAGEPVTFTITADAPGTIHVHSTPEQEFAYDEGTSTHEITIETPGLVDVESHELGVTMVQLAVR